MVGLRIAFVIDRLYPYTIGGAEKRYWEIGIRLSKRHEIHFITLRYWHNHQSSGYNPHVKDHNIIFHGVSRPYELYDNTGKRRLSSALRFSIEILPKILEEDFKVLKNFISKI